MQVLNAGSQTQTKTCKMYIPICKLPSNLCEDCLHSLTVLGPLFHWLWQHQPGRWRGLAQRWPVFDAVVPILGQCWAGRHCRLGGNGWLAQGCVWVALSICTCKIIIISVKTIIFITMICNSPLSKLWLVCLKLSPALSTLWAILSPALCTLWTQHCSGGRKKTTIYCVCHSSRITYTHISQRDR